MDFILLLVFNVCKRGSSYVRTRQYNGTYVII